MGVLTNSKRNENLIAVITLNHVVVFYSDGLRRRKVHDDHCRIVGVVCDVVYLVLVPIDFSRMDGVRIFLVRVVIGHGRLHDY